MLFENGGAKMNTITLEQLKEHNACLEQMLLFNEIFGEEVKVTVKRCVKYYDKFSWEWAAMNLLSNELCGEFLNIIQPAREEYLKIEQPAWKEYLKIKQLAYEEYLKIRRSAYEEYSKIRRSAYKEYEKIEQLARKEYLKKKAQAFGECYLNMKEG